MNRTAHILIVGFATACCALRVGFAAPSTNDTSGVTVNFVAYTNANGHSAALFSVSNGMKQVVQCLPHHQFEFQTVTGVVRSPIVIVEHPGWPGYIQRPSPRLAFGQTGTLEVVGLPTGPDKWRIGFWIQDESTKAKQQSQIWSPLSDPKR